LFDAFSSREPVPTSLENALDCVVVAPVIGRPPAPETITFAFRRSLASTLSREWEP